MQTMELDFFILVFNSVLDLMILYVLFSLKHPRRITATYDLICNFFLADFLVNAFGARFDPWYANLFALESKNYVFDKYLSLTCLATAILTLIFLNLLSCNGCFQKNPAIAITTIWILSILFFAHSYSNKNRTFWNLVPLGIFSLMCVIGEYFKRATSFEYWRRSDDVKVVMPLVYIACNAVIVKAKYHMEREPGNGFAVALFTSLNLSKSLLLLFYMSRADPIIKEAVLQYLWKRVDPPLPAKASVADNEITGCGDNANRFEELNKQDIGPKSNSISSYESYCFIHDLTEATNPRRPLYTSLPVVHHDHRLRNIDYNRSAYQIRNNECSSKLEQSINNGNCSNNIDGECGSSNITVDSSKNASNSA